MTAQAFFSSLIKFGEVSAACDDSSGFDAPAAVARIKERQLNVSSRQLRTALLFLSTQNFVRCVRDAEVEVLENSEALKRVLKREASTQADNFVTAVENTRELLTSSSPSYIQMKLAYEKIPVEAQNKLGGLDILKTTTFDAFSLADAVSE